MKEMRKKAMCIIEIRVFQAEETTKVKWKCTYHVLRKANSQMCGYSRKNEMVSQGKLGQNVGRKFILWLSLALSHLRVSWRGVNDMTCLKIITLDLTVRVEFGFIVIRIS